MSLTGSGEPTSNTAPTFTASTPRSPGNSREGVRLARLGGRLPSGDVTVDQVLVQGGARDARPPGCRVVLAQQAGNPPEHLAGRATSLRQRTITPWMT